MKHQGLQSNFNEVSSDFLGFSERVSGKLSADSEVSGDFRGMGEVQGVIQWTSEGFRVFSSGFRKVSGKLKKKVSSVIQIDLLQKNFRTVAAFLSTVSEKLQGVSWRIQRV